MKRWLPILTIVLLLLAGCVEYDEELWLNPNGSGKVKLRLVHRSSFANTQEIMRKSELPGIHLIDSQVSQSGPYMVYKVTFKFDDIESFNNINDQLSAADFWGQITLNKNTAGNVVFKRRISLGGQQEAMEGMGSDPNDINSMEDPNDILEGIYRQQQKEHPMWTYKLHVPWKIISASTTSDNINEKERTVTWKFDTLQMWNKYELMSVEMKKGVSWLIYVLALLVAALLAFFVVWLVKINKRSHLKDAIRHKEEREKQPLP
jgi:hypothetical protein